MSSVIFTVEVDVKDEFTEMVYTFMQAMHKLTHEFDKGCIQYDLYRDKKNKSKFFFIEEWDSEESLEEHRQKEHYKNFMGFIDGKLDSIDKKLEKVDTKPLEKFVPIDVENLPSNF